MSLKPRAAMPPPQAALVLLTLLVAPLATAEIATVYTSVAGGRAEMKAPNPLAEAVDDRGSVYRLLVGYRYEDMPAIEGGVVRFDDFSIGSQDIDATGFTFGVAAELPLNLTYSLRGRLGMMAWDTGDDSGVDPYFGVGVSMQIGPDSRAALEFERYETDGIDIEAIMLGVQFFADADSLVSRSR